MILYVNELKTMIEVQRIISIGSRKRRRPSSKPRKGSLPKAHSRRTVPLGLANKICPTVVFYGVLSGLKMSRKNSGFSIAFSSRYFVYRLFIFCIPRFYHILFHQHIISWKYTNLMLVPKKGKKGSYHENTAFQRRRYRLDHPHEGSRC